MASTPKPKPPDCGPLPDALKIWSAASSPQEPAAARANREHRVAWPQPAVVTQVGGQGDSGSPDRWRRIRVRGRTRDLGGDAGAHPFFRADRVAELLRVGEHVAAAKRPPRDRCRHGLDAAVAVEPVIGDMDGGEHRLRRSHALKRQHETGIRFAGAHRPLTPWIGVVGERGEQRRPPAVVGIRHLPVRPCTRRPPGLDPERVAAQRIGRSGRRAHHQLVGVGFQGWRPERRQERAPGRVPACRSPVECQSSTGIGPGSALPA